MNWSGRLWAAGFVLAAAAGIGIALWRAPRTVEVPADDDDRPASSSPAPATTPPKPAGPVMPAPPDLAQAPPRGVSPAQWAALRAELASRPEELQRVAAYLDYSAALREFGALPAGSAEKRRLAARLDAGLDERLQRREMSAGEARLVKTALLETLEPDPAARDAALARWQDAWRARPIDKPPGGDR